MKKSPIILILIFNFLFVFGCNSDDNNERPSDDSGMSDIRGDGGFGKDADVVQDSASDQETEKDSSPDIAEDTTLNSSVEIEADLTILQSCDVVCRNLQRECEIVPILLGMGGCIAEYGPDTFFVFGCDVVPEASYQGVAISRQECKCGPVN